MAKTLKESPITTANARRKLPPGEYARRLDADAAIWYRNRAGGSWFARWRNHGPGANYKQATIGPANDVNDKPTDGLFTFQQAETAARDIVARARREAKAAADGPLLTVRSVVESYVAERDAREAERKGRPARSDAAQRLSRYVLGQPPRGKQEEVAPAPLASVAFHALTEADLQSWRDGLPDTMKASTRQRLINDLKAALNAAKPGRVDPMLPTIIKDGLAAKRSHSSASEPRARDNQILSDAEVMQLVGAAREIDAEQGWEGDLYRLVLVLAATGARFSQVVRMQVGDVQPEQLRLLVPVSRKGQGDKAMTHISRRVGADVIDALVPIITGRRPSEALLQRWRHTQKPGSIGAWERSARAPWAAPSELSRPWRDIRQRAGLPECIPYALRHSSIVRQLRENLGIRYVAAAHDTSTMMIERHYSRWIVDELEEMAARAIVPLVPATGGGARIIKMGGR